METANTEPNVEIKRSDSIAALATALAKFQGAVQNVKKDSSNPFYKSKYAALDAIVEAIRKPLSDAQLAYTQWPVGKYHLVTLLVHSSGEYIQATVEMTPKDDGPQAHGSVITYMRRYVLSSILGIATEDDDDGNAASGTAKTTTIVKNEKVGAGDVYAQAVDAITKAKTMPVLEKLQENIDGSDKLTDTQKDTLEKMINNKADDLIGKDK